MNCNSDSNIVTRTAPGLCAVCKGITAHWLPAHLAADRLCREPGTRGRICADFVNHDGPHNFVPQSVRED